MQEIAPRSRIENELTNCIRIIRIIQHDWSILSPFKISNQFLASWTQGFIDATGNKSAEIVLHCR